MKKIILVGTVLGIGLSISFTAILWAYNTPISSEGTVRILPTKTIQSSDHYIAHVK